MQDNLLEIQLLEALQYKIPSQDHLHTNGYKWHNYVAWYLHVDNKNLSSLIMKYRSCNFGTHTSKRDKNT